MAEEKIVLPGDHFRKRVGHQYNDIPMAIVREIIQNSQDAGANKVEFAFDEGEFNAWDDGKGMDLEEFRNFYLTLGGTKKESGSIGGFGAAKELLSFAWPSWVCRGQGFMVTGHGADTPQSSKVGGVDKGFFVGASDGSFYSKDFLASLRRLVGLSNLSCQVICGSADLESGRTLRSNQLFREYDFGKVYIHKSQPAGFEETGHLYIRTRGLFTGSEYIGGDYVYYLDLDKASPDVLTENRDSLRYNIRTQIQQDLQAISRNPGNVEKRSLAKITVHGSYCAASSGHNAERGSFGIEDGGQVVWRKPFAICEENKKANVATDENLLKPKYGKALEVWSTVLNLISDVMEIDRFMPGLYFGNEAHAIHINLAGQEMIAAGVSEILDDSPFAVLELAMHEIAHHWRADHSQEFESARMTIARTLGNKAMAIVETVRRMQNEPAKRGMYWA